jgi:t-SNARE complex subunit (syntaxin)
MDKVNIPNTAYFRDIHSKAILNTDKRGRDKYQMEREIALKEKNEKEANNQRLNKLEQDMSEIKNLLNEIIRKV